MNNSLLVIDDRNARAGENEIPQAAIPPVPRIQFVPPSSLFGTLPHSQYGFMNVEMPLAAQQAAMIPQMQRSLNMNTYLYNQHMQYSHELMQQHQLNVLQQSYYHIPQELNVQQASISQLNAFNVPEANVLNDANHPIDNVVQEFPDVCAGIRALIAGNAQALQNIIQELEQDPLYVQADAHTRQMLIDQRALTDPRVHNGSHLFSRDDPESAENQPAHARGEAAYNPLEEFLTRLNHIELRQRILGSDIVAERLLGMDPHIDPVDPERIYACLRRYRLSDLINGAVWQNVDLNYPPDSLENEVEMDSSSDMSPGSVGSSQGGEFYSDHGEEMYGYDEEENDYGEEPDEYDEEPNDYDEEPNGYGEEPNEYGEEQNGYGEELSDDSGESNDDGNGSNGNGDESNENGEESNGNGEGSIQSGEESNENDEEAENMVVYHFAPPRFQDPDAEPVSSSDDKSRTQHPFMRREETAEPSHQSRNYPAVEAAVVRTDCLNNAEGKSAEGDARMMAVREAEAAEQVIQRPNPLVQAIVLNDQTLDNLEAIAFELEVSNYEVVEALIESYLAPNDEDGRVSSSDDRTNDDRVLLVSVEEPAESLALCPNRRGEDAERAAQRLNESEAEAAATRSPNEEETEAVDAETQRLGDKPARAAETGSQRLDEQIPGTAEAEPQRSKDKGAGAVDTKIQRSEKQNIGTGGTETRCSNNTEAVTNETEIQRENEQENRAVDSETQCTNDKEAGAAETGTQNSKDQTAETNEQGKDGTNEREQEKDDSAREEPGNSGSGSEDEQSESELRLNNNHSGSESDSTDDSESALFLTQDQMHFLNHVARTFPEAGLRRRIVITRPIIMPEPIVTPKRRASRRRKVTRRRKVKERKPPIRQRIYRPSFIEMIKTAISESESKKASKTAILRYIINNYEFDINEKMINNRLMKTLNELLVCNQVKRTGGRGMNGSFYLAGQYKRKEKEPESIPQAAQVFEGAITMTIEAANTNTGDVDLADANSALAGILGANATATTSTSTAETTGAKNSTASKANTSVTISNNFSDVNKTASSVVNNPTASNTNTAHLSMTTTTNTSNSNEADTSVANCNITSAAIRANKAIASNPKTSIVSKTKTSATSNVAVIEISVAKTPGEIIAKAIEMAKARAIEAIEAEPIDIGERNPFFPCPWDEDFEDPFEQSSSTPSCNTAESVNQAQISEAPPETLKTVKKGGRMSKAKSAIWKKFNKECIANRNKMECKHPAYVHMIKEAIKVNEDFGGSMTHIKNYIKAKYRFKRPDQVSANIERAVKRLVNNGQLAKGESLFYVNRKIRVSKRLKERVDKHFTK